MYICGQNMIDMYTTVKKNNVELEIEFDYQPYEPETFAYPGCAESVEITTVILNGTDITEFILEFGDIEEFERLVLLTKNQDL